MPETVSSTTFGLVYTPGFVEGLSIALDLHSMEVDEVITQLSPMGVLNGCFVAEDPGLCSLFTRDPSGEISELFTGTGNANALTLESIDLAVDYRIGEMPWLPGEWGVRWETAYLGEMEVCTLQSTGFVGCKDYAQTNTGDAALPMFRSNLTLDWAYGEWEAAWRMRFIGRHYEACSAPTLTSIAVSRWWGGTPPAGWTYCSNPTASTNALGATTYHSVQVSYTVAEWDTRLVWGVENLFGKKPPVSTQAFANSFDPTTYEVPGKFVYLRVEKTF
jgi:outer membrane receptor protein involved in Fe transport